MSEKLQVEIKKSEENSGLEIVEFSGDFDKVGYNSVHDVLNAAVKGFEGKALVFDFNEVEFINSEGIGYLLEVHNFLAKKDKKLVIVGVNAYVDDIFQTIGIRDIVAIYKNVDDFLKQ